jgi:hypothetical protein
MPVSDPTLRDLMDRLDALELRNDRLEQENDRLHGHVVALTASLTHTSSAAAATPLAQLSRRWVLRRGMQVAAAGVAAGVLWQHDAREASATTHFGLSDFNTACNGGSFCDATDPVIKITGDATYAGLGAVSAGIDHHTIAGRNTGSGNALYGETTSDDRPAIWGENFGSDVGVYGRNAGTGPAILGVADGLGGTGVKGTGRYGVWGESNQAGFWGVVGRNTGGGTGVRGEGLAGVHGISSATGYEGVYGQFTGSAGYGVVGDGAGSASAGVLGRNSSGHGVRGEGLAGVVGVSEADGWEGVFGQHTGTNGYGVVGDGKGTGSGVLGRNNVGTGLRGEGKTGVWAKSTTTGGYAGIFEGGKAQLRLVPKSTAGRPTTGTHQKGELYLDSTGSLFVCTANGTPGSWRQVSTTTA